jgi:hypothetical protein
MTVPEAVGGEQLPGKKELRRIDPMMAACDPRSSVHRKDAALTFHVQVLAAPTMAPSCRPEPPGSRGKGHGTSLLEF